MKIITFNSCDECPYFNHTNSFCEILEIEILENDDDKDCPYDEGNIRRELWKHFKR